MSDLDNKLKVEIYVPLDACACEWDQFMNRIFTILTPYMKYIKYVGYITVSVSQTTRNADIIFLHP